MSESLAVPKADRNTAATRKPLSKKLRFEVFKRDGFKCQYCGCTPNQSVLEVDHINPVALGGKNEMDNLIAACFDCNRGKSKNPLDIIPEGFAEKAKRIKEQEAQIKQYRAVMDEQVSRLHDDTHRVCEALYPDCDSYLKTEMKSIKSFLGMMDLYQVIEAAEIAYCAVPHSTARRFKYFCAVCWNMIKGK